MSRTLAKIPIKVHPLFWVLAGLIGYINSRNFSGSILWAMIILWMIVIFISVLFHELGHAITARLFKQESKIALVAFGGVTTYKNKDLKFWQQFLVVLNGPLFGIVLFLFATFLLYLNFTQNAYIVNFFRITQIVNLFWTIVNLLPVLPLDGGQLLRIVLEAAFGVKGFKLSLFIGMLVALALSVFFFIKGGFLIGALFFLFGFQSFEMWRKSKFLTPEDRDTNKASLLQEGEIALQEGQKEKAKEIFEKIRKTIKGGMIYTSATHYLAILKFEEGDKHSAYDLLLKIKDQLPDQAKCILHSLAFEENNYPVVVEYSTICYQLNPSMDTALKNAKAFASLKEGKPSGGWLQTASQYNNFNLGQVLQEDVFNDVKEDQNFNHFIEEIKKTLQ